MLRIDYNGENVPQLIDEIRSLNLPGFNGVARLSRDVDDGGNAVLGDGGKPQKVSPYLFIKSDSLSPDQEAAVRTIVANHIPEPIIEPPAPEDPKITALKNATTVDQVRDAVVALHT